MISAMNAAPMADDPSMPRAAAYAWAAGEPDHAPSGTSSPPTCSHGDGNRSASAPATASRNGRVAATPGLSTLSTNDCTLTAPLLSAGSRSAGTAARAAKQCPGRSTSGTMTTPAAAARATHAGDLRGRVRAAERRRARTEQRRDRHAVTAPRADLGQRRVVVDRHAPGLVVGQVQVQPVEAPPCGDVDQPVDIGGREELPGQVDVQAPPAVRRRVARRPDLPGAALPGERGERHAATSRASRRSPRSVSRRR